MFDIQEQLKKLPDCPGVYLHKDSLGEIIYVGKAVSLKNRVRQYFQSSRNMDPKVRSMVSQIAEFEYIRAGSEVEALILECNLIKKYRPKYNILLRDDKTYPYIKITNEPWPRIVKTRQINKDGGRYFGPYSDAGAVNRIVDLLNSSFALKRCSAVAFPPGFRPCLNYHINQCRGICDGSADPDEYAKAIEGAAEFLKGRSNDLIRTLKEKMMAASDAMNYEEAAVYRDHLEAAKALMETQRVVMHHSEEADILIPIKSGDNSYVAVFFVRGGKLTGRESFAMDDAGTAGAEDWESSMIEAFVSQHYSRLTDIPKEILLTVDLPGSDAIEGFLTAQAGHNVSVHRPMRGEKRALVDLARKDAEEMAKTIDDRAKSARDRREKLGREIFDILVAMGAEGDGAVDAPTGVPDDAVADAPDDAPIDGAVDAPAGVPDDAPVDGAVDASTGVPDEAPTYDGREYRVEAYDISNTNGVDTVGAMVTFQGLDADKKGYRKFKVRSIEGQDDYGAMREVLSRRFTRVFKGDDSFAQLPDIIFMDGGRGHVSTALEVIDATGFDIPVVGMVKDDNHRTRALIYRKPGHGGSAGDVNLGEGTNGTAGDVRSDEGATGTAGERSEYVEIPLADKPLLFTYIGRIQEEVHRFAIEYHRKVRSNKAQRSVLDEIPGIGEKRRNALLRTFKSVDRIKEIALSEDGVDRLAEAESMDRRAAESICSYFGQADAAGS